VIQLYQKINEFLNQPDADDEPTLEELFLEADRIGQKYQTPEEIRAFNQEMAAEANAVSDLVDQQFPETDVEVIDFCGSFVVVVIGKKRKCTGTSTNIIYLSTILIAIKISNHFALGNC